MKDAGGEGVFLDGHNFINSSFLMKHRGSCDFYIRSVSYEILGSETQGRRVTRIVLQTSFLFNNFVTLNHIFFFDVFKVFESDAAFEA